MGPVVSVLDVVLNVARGHLWVRETAGANRGEVVDRIIRATGLDPAKPPAGLASVPWCAAFVAYVGRLALGTRWPLPPVAGCVSLAEAAQRAGLLRTVPLPGAIFLLWSPRANRYAHTGFVETLAADGETWGTIEGNTSVAGSLDGDGVYQRKRHGARTDRFIWWWLDVSFGRGGTV